jgi:hypothetical protein
MSTGAYRSRWIGLFIWAWIGGDQRQYSFVKSSPVGRPALRITKTSGGRMRATPPAIGAYASRVPTAH